MLFEIEVVETVAARRKYLVQADNETDARAAAEAGSSISEETLRTEGVVARTVEAVKPYAGPQYIVEQLEDDPEYFHVVDSKTGDIVELCYGRTEAEESAASFNNGDHEQFDQPDAA